MLNALRNLLRAPEQKASRTAQLIAFESGGRARWTPRDYTALAREGYVKNAIRLSRGEAGCRECRRLRAAGRGGRRDARPPSAARPTRAAEPPPGWRALSGVHRDAPDA